ncbi:XRE family transcriptional regulator [Rothia nasimurium]|uniref:XRE family transcriptional regulator n=1 Tax=Rothia nasimurium TaxID=85336 RepID=A0A4Y9F4Y0_9MICC|nr:helix-turn-helix transcriptional regulator [Rothia nasimurium]TFU23274.1 XRE family transcriptional regulator [Rothia nasimurium]
MHTSVKPLGVNQVITREIKSALSREGLSQKELANRLGISAGSVSLKMRAEVSFTMNELLSIAGILNLSLSELLGDSLLLSRVPTPEYMEDEKGEKKVAPVGFIPNGTTYQMVAGAGFEPAASGL